jgi:hypothetical protein
VVCKTCLAVKALLMAAGITATWPEFIAIQLLGRGIDASVGHIMEHHAEARSMIPSTPIPGSPKPKAKRRVGAYQKQFGKELKALKKKHPRTAQSTLMKRAHRNTKKRRI